MSVLITNPEIAEMTNFSSEKMNANESSYVMNGWDLIAATKQKVINKQLLKLPEITVNSPFEIKVFGTSINCKVDVELGAPQIAPAERSGSKVDVTFPIRGEIVMGDTEIELPDNQIFIVTTDLTEIEAMLQDKKEEDMTKFDLILNMTKGFLVDIKVEGLNAAELVSLTELLAKIIKEKIGDDGKEFEIASFYLANDKVKILAPLIPHLADFTFIRNDDNIEESNFLILMLTTSTKKGNIYFNELILPDDQDSMTMLSNNIFINDIVRPGVVEGIKGEAKDKDKVNDQIKTRCIDDRIGNEMYQVYNDGKIKLEKDHNPWINTFELDVNSEKESLYTYIDVKADVTFMDIHIDTWVKSWSKLTVDENQMIDIKEINTDSGHKTQMEWWKWTIVSLVALITAFIGSIFGMILLIAVGIMNAFASNNNPDLGDNLQDMAKDLVQWPNQKYIRIEEIITPGNIVFFMKVDF
ncbi:hypothetical protein HN014_21965 [Aquimarina sp. TRL1]|uniref:hypothetical protein n=1 Tax=Aquimarina sp. (strain TRL1) TaxID=2736252 RepID=UPI001589304C|nr:hypothetical protein [Aquimarina sp. TRL1]QKX07470.1 hypothetical protein HN014_21965 [Aquimarina sp. TRL1]